EPVENLRKAISACKEALRFYTPENAPFDYAITQKNLGTTWLYWAEIEEELEQRCTYLKAAIQAFAEALRFLTPKATPR
ncbi:MAG: tetratricopeptide repeat protein, partial [Anaerolineae bacterium]|nr:tetratricopeptide repeat protein [Anaerolineae bacterium]